MLALFHCLNDVRPCFLLFVYLFIYLFIYCAGDKMEKNEMGGACGTYGGRERCAQGFGGET